MENNENVTVTTKETKKTEKTENKKKINVKDLVIGFVGGVITTVIAATVATVIGEKNEGPAE